jgi:hypothetical protein
LDTANYAFGRIEFTGNTTLTNLSEGSHTLRLSLETESHSLLRYEYFFLTVYFTIDSNQSTTTSTPTEEPTPTPEPNLSIDPNFSLYTGLALLIIILVVFAVFLFIMRKHKK